MSPRLHAPYYNARRFRFFSAALYRIALFLQHADLMKPRFANQIEVPLLQLGVGDAADEEILRIPKRRGQLCKQNDI